MAKQTTATKAPQEVTKSPPTQPEGLEQYDFQALLEKHKTKSAVIRYLTQEGLSRSDIAKVTGLRYQHVRNVQLMPIGKRQEEQA
jgi:hypothetical protein